MQWCIYCGKNGCFSCQEQVYHQLSMAGVRKVNDDEAGWWHIVEIGGEYYHVLVKEA